VSYLLHLGTATPLNPSNDQSLNGTSFTPVSSAIGSLKPGIKYFWSVEAVGSTGLRTSDTDGIRSFTVASPPAALSNLKATAVSATEIGLSWQANSDDETGFKIQRKTGANGSYGIPRAVLKGTTSYQDAGLDASTTYYYQVWAYNTIG